MASAPLSSSESSVRSFSQDPPQNYTFSFAALTSLFFMWGFVTNLNDILVPHLKGVFDLNYVQAALVQFAFFTAYFVMAIPGGLVVARFGYKYSIVIGLCISALGAILFVPAASMLSYNVFLLGLFTLASGFTVLQVAVNPYVSVLGKPETAASRLNLAGGFNSLGASLGPFVGGMFILATVALTKDQLAALPFAEQTAHRMAEAASVKVPYMLLAASLFALAVFFAILKLPALHEIGDDSYTHRHKENQGKLLDALQFRQLRFGVIGIFAYVGAEVAVGSFLINFAGLPEIAGLRESDAAKYASYYWGSAMIGRFLGAAITQRVKSQHLLLIAAVCASVLVMAGWLGAGWLALWALVLVNFFNSVMWPNIFTLAINGLGKQTNHGSSLLVMMILGGALVPLLQGKLADTIGLHHSFFIPLLCYAYIGWYAFSGHKAK
ncbi:MAG: L-fucose:H+ symporter permease [Candidatus Kapaibacterium sp.]|nr:MAG: L-fucose:H+ symporter permease [Candidatus Kapabacteria bacterium]